VIRALINASAELDKPDQSGVTALMFGMIDYLTNFYLLY
jgi:hypothetical protein